jgi:hypothetical protein
MQISTKHDFRVAAGLELVSELPELAAQLDKIVDLAGVDEGDRRPSLFLVLHRLHTAGQVDDRKTAMPQAGMPADPDAARIRAAAFHCLRHRLNGLALPREVALVANPACYAAHPVLLSFDLMRRSVAEGHASLSQSPIGADAPCPVVAVANLPFGVPAQANAKLGQPSKTSSRQTTKHSQEKVGRDSLRQRGFAFQM